jgi:Protein of unknown function (DUF3551)
MIKLLGSLAFLLMIGGAGTPAQAAAWCAFYSPSTYNCGFHTYQQCLATVRGAGGWCRQNFFESGDRKSTRRRAGGDRY